MDIKKSAVAAMIALVLPMGFACAMPEAVTEAAVAHEMSTSSPDVFVGWWGEKVAGRGRITVTHGENGWYGVEVCWSRSAYQVDMWTMSVVPMDNNIYQYTDCSHYLLTYNRDMLEREDVLYKDGTGRFFLDSDEEVRWQDDQDHVADHAVFVRLDMPNGGGL